MSDDLVKRLRNTPNWMREEYAHYNHYKDGLKVFDRAPFEAAYALEAQAAQITRLRVAFKWDIERDGDDLLICEGDHERHEGCTMQRWVKAENVATARREGRKEMAEYVAGWHEARAKEHDAMEREFKTIGQHLAPDTMQSARRCAEAAIQHRQRAAAIRAAAVEGK